MDHFVRFPFPPTATTRELCRRLVEIPKQFDNRKARAEARLNRLAQIENRQRTAIR